MSKQYITSNLSGIEVYVDRYIVKDDYLYFCSCFKGAESVKGAQAGFLQSMDWQIDGRVFTRLPNNYRQLTVKLTPAITHGIVYAADFFDGKSIFPLNIVFGNTKQEVRHMAYNRLKAYTPVPLLDEWKEAIINDMLPMLEMEQFGFGFVYELELPTEVSLKEYVLANIEALTKLTEK